MIIATAGHVDHGKTSLVRSLTGVDTDRLEEEKRRGLSIDLGFAYRELDDGKQLGFVDVPGHSRFINTMIAGASGVDAGLLVVAADDGVMPQTREHVDVLRLLGVTDVVAVVSKTDRVDGHRVESVQTEVAALLGNLCQAAFAISNTTGEGIEELQRYLEQRGQSHRSRPAAGNFRLPVDRAFTLRGVGLILTGTVATGEVTRGAELRLLPDNISLRVRSLRVQDSEAETGRAGDRCALNVVGDIDRHTVSRGDVLAGSDRVPVVERFDALLRLIPDAAIGLKHMAPVKVYLGAGRLEARVYLLDCQQNKVLRPGEEVQAQLILDRPAPCCRGDRFLVRDSGESITLGGGMVLDPWAPQFGKSRPSRLHYLEAMASGTVGESLRALLAMNERPVNVSALARAWNLREDEEQALTTDVPAHYFERENERFAASPALWSRVEKQLIQCISQWHRDQPEQAGIKPAELQGRLGDLPTGLFLPVLRRLLQTARLQLVDGRVRMPGHRAALQVEQEAAWTALRRILEQRGENIPLVPELVEQTGIQKARVVALLDWATRNGQAFKLSDARYALPGIMAQFARSLQQIVDRGETVTVVSFKSEIGAGRKLAIELLEHFDAVRFTRRRGDQRTVIDPSVPASVYDSVS